VGPARGDSDLTAWRDEAAQAAWAIAGLLSQGEARAPANLVKVDRSRCALCLTCVRVCPRGAMSKRGRRPFSNPLVCTACGTCAAECPMDAIQLLGQEDDRYQAQIKAAVTPGWELDRGPESELMVFLCAKSAGAALAAARLEGLPLPANARFVEVPCAGRLDPALVMEAFGQGFDGVLVIACHVDACYSLEGNAWAEMRVEHLQRLMKEAGFHHPRRLVMGRVQATQTHRLAALVTEAAQGLEELAGMRLRGRAQVQRILGRFTVETDESYTLL
jgi:coenzyme F420-reducing hydrogenase delta subunit/Pyruvate/2-oxoacid:ferredoxin oxidoreductase delta subunit